MIEDNKNIVAIFTCKLCHGTGNIYVNGRDIPCDLCKGRGWVKKDE